MASGRKLDDFISPMLARETSESFDDDRWIFEIKWDGYRAVSEVMAGQVKLYSRNGNDFSNRYPAVIAALESITHKAVLDGEVVVLNDKGFPDFQMLQHFDDNPGAPIEYHVFDLLSLDGHDLYDQPLIKRKELLESIIPENSIIKYSSHVAGQGNAFFEAALKNNLEGMMAKKSDSKYLPGRRTTEWLKVKGQKTADVVIAGYTEAAGARNYFGALVLALKKENEWVHVGQAGTGYDEAALKKIFNLLQPLKISASPFKQKIQASTNVTWVRPAVVCEVKFSEWTKDEKLRHPVFLQIRNDKPLKDVSMNAQKPVEKKSVKTVSATSAVKRQKTAEKTAKKGVRKALNSSSEKAGEKPKKNTSGKDVFVVGNKQEKVVITHPDKIYFPQDKITKKMIVEYYQSIGKFILPFLKGRPESLKRNPNGINDQGFFHKDAGENTPPYIDTFKVFSPSANKEIDYIICNDKLTLAYMNNLGCIEINPWHSTKQKPDHPDYLIIDIDPSEKNTFDQVVEVANAFKKVLDKAGAKSYCKTSGSTGLHIYVPMKKKYDYDQVKDFAQLLCMLVQDMLPEFTTMERNLRKRGNKKIYLDHLQNRSGQTISSVYSLRPKKGATVSMPLEWKEVKKGLSPLQFTIHNSAKRIAKDPDIFKGIFGPATNIAACIRKLS